MGIQGRVGKPIPTDQPVVHRRVSGRGHGHIRSGKFHGSAERHGEDATEEHIPDITQGRTGQQGQLRPESGEGKWLHQLRQ